MRAAVGEAAWRFDLPTGASGERALAALSRRTDLVDVVVSEQHVLVTFDPSSPPVGVEEAMLAAAGESLTASARPTHVIRIRYDGPDLARVAAHSKLPEDEVIRLHTAREYNVRVVGFLPGFAYLGDVDARIAAPRLPSPRARVPALSVGVAGSRTGIYPCTSPGGWNLLGTAIGFTAFDPDLGATLRLGDRVRFEAA